MSRYTVVLAGIIVASGCATTGDQAHRAAGGDGFDVVISVDNDQWYEMRIFVEGGIGAQKILGNVPARSSRTFTVPRQLLEGSSDLRLIADPQGSARQMMSQPVDLSSGHNLHWKLRSSGTQRLRVM